MNVSSTIPLGRGKRGVSRKSQLRERKRKSCPPRNNQGDSEVGFHNIQKKESSALRGQRDLNR